METLKQNSHGETIKTLVGAVFMFNSNLLRYIGNFLLLSGYFFLLWGDLKIGLLVKCIGNFFVIPFAIKYKFWDILILCGFYAAIEIPKLIQVSTK
jgi:hypothetical protein